MSQVIVPTNLGISPATGYRNGPAFIGVENWREELNIGDGAMTLVCAFSPAGTLVGAPTLPTLSGNDRWGFPMAVFAQMNSQAVSPKTNAAKSNCPVNGWGLFWGGGLRLNMWLWNNCPGTNDPTASTYRQMSINALSNVAGAWNRFAIVKAANATGDSSFSCAVNGTAGTLSHSGTCNSIGDVAPYAMMRWFHMVNSWAQMISVSSVAAGIWIYNTAFTTTQAANVTKAPGASGQIDPLDSSIVGNLIARNYSGAADWKAIAPDTTKRPWIWATNIGG